LSYLLAIDYDRTDQIIILEHGDGKVGPRTSGRIAAKYRQAARAMESLTWIYCRRSLSRPLGALTRLL
jgi:hypothetical protein